MLTRCPSCETHFRVTAEQLKVRAGRVRCGACQHVFNALDSLIEEPTVVVVAAPASAAPPEELAPAEAEAGTRLPPQAPGAEEFTGPPAPTPESEPTPELIPESVPEPEPVPESAPESVAGSAPESMPESEPEPAPLPSDAYAEPAAGAAPLAAAAARPEPDITGTKTPEPDATDADAAVEHEASDWSEAFPEPPPPPRRWPWVIGSLFALVALGLQLALGFRVELVVLWPQTRPAMTALCQFAGCEIGLPAKVNLIGIEASDLHPDSDHPGRLALAATLKNRAPFAQQFPHLELTLTDTADQAVARRILAPADYLPRTTAIADGMPPNADIMLTVGVEPRDMPASGYRLYLFYP